MGPVDRSVPSGISTCLLLIRFARMRHAKSKRRMAIGDVDMRPFLLLVILFMMSACDPANRPSVVPAQFIEIAAPNHPQIELYINQYGLGPKQGAILRPDFSNWTVESKMKNTASTNQEGKPRYSATVQYLGRKPDADVYSLTISFPHDGEFETFTQEVQYSGGDTEVWRDDLYRIGLRPSSNEKD